MMYPSSIPQLPLPFCELCRTCQGLQPCPCCEAVYYCGLEHLVKDGKRHGDACSAIEKAISRFEKSEWFVDYFDAGTSRFWNHRDTRRYMRRRLAMIDTMRAHFPARRLVVEHSLNHLLDMLCLDPDDHLHLQIIVPSLFLRLGRDQEAYDFVKSWSIGPRDGSPTRCQNENVFENAEVWRNSQMYLSQAADVMLVKLRVWLDLLAMQNATRALQVRHTDDSITSVLPREILDQIRGELLSGQIVAKRRDLVTASVGDLEGPIATVKEQIRFIYKAIKRINLHFWPMMAKFVRSPPPMDLQEDEPLYMHIRSGCSAGSVAAARLRARCVFRAWKETDGAMSVIAALRKARA